MNPAGKALWYIESHHAEDITLDEIAQAACVSRYHLSRLFGVVMQQPVMRYLRGRRLSHAAQALACGSADILGVAIASGYGSHEAFTRAFREQFGITPEQVRAQGHVNDLKLVEPIKMDETLLEELEQPRVEMGRPLLIAGLSQRYNAETCAAIPAQWQRFGPHIGRVPGQVGHVTYGVVCNSDDAGNIDYICGVEVGDFSAIPEDWARLRIPAQRYLVFQHHGHIAGIRRTWFTILNQYLPDSGYEMADAPEYERYDEKFNPATGMGGLEIWVPVKG